MSHQSATELLESLRANLKHFEDCRQWGDPEDVAAIRGKLVRRIADMERIVALAHSRPV